MMCHISCCVPSIHIGQTCTYVAHIEKHKSKPRFQQLGSCPSTYTCPAPPLPSTVRVCATGHGGAPDCPRCPRGTWSTAGDRTTTPVRPCTPRDAGLTTQSGGSTNITACTCELYTSLQTSLLNVTYLSFKKLTRANGCAACLFVRFQTTLCQPPTPASPSITSSLAGCTPGFGRLNNTSISCEPCSVNKYSPGATSTINPKPLCTPCAAGTFAFKPGAASCEHGAWVVDSVWQARPLSGIARCMNT